MLLSYLPLGFGHAEVAGGLCLPGSRLAPDHYGDGGVGVEEDEEGHDILETEEAPGVGLSSLVGPPLLTAHTSTAQQ